MISDVISCDLCFSSSELYKKLSTNKAEHAIAGYWHSLLKLIQIFQPYFSLWNLESILHDQADKLENWIGWIWSAMAWIRLWMPFL